MIAAAITAVLGATNIYTGIKANQENAKNAKKSIRHSNQLAAHQYQAKKKIHTEMTDEYVQVCSYSVDKLRQKNLTDRQALSYNILKSGLGISENDSVGQLIRLKAHEDEMAARAFEMEKYHHRPRMNQTKEGLDISIDHGRQKINDINKTTPWANVASTTNSLSNIMQAFQQQGVFS